jgi:quinol monooxygenase YgiN
MRLDRREFDVRPAAKGRPIAGAQKVGRFSYTISWSLGLLLLALSGSLALATAGLAAEQQRPGAMFGLIGKMNTVPGQRDALIAILLEGTANMPGCSSYIVATDPGDANAVWITEVWDNEASHKASLSLPAVQAAIAKGRPLIAGFGERFVTAPVGGVGLPPRIAR